MPLTSRRGAARRVLRVVRYRVLRLLERRGTLPAKGPEDALQAYQAHSLQQRLRWTGYGPAITRQQWVEVGPLPLPERPTP